jgi:lambda family phage portal protein
MSTSVVQSTGIRNSAVDRLVALVSPARALRRLESRVRLEAASQFFGVGGYTGARYDRQATKDWTPAPISADSAIIPDLPTLRARGRDLERNAPIATGAINTHCMSVVGGGLTPHPRLDRELLGLTEEEADKWERHASRIWAAFAASKSCDLANKNTFAGITYLTLRSWLSSGDTFVLRRYKERPGDLLGLKLQLVEADRVCNPNYKFDTDRMIGGIELDDDGAPIRYHVANRHPGDIGSWGGIKWTGIDAVGANTGTPQVLHVLRQDRIDQTRGVPLLAPVIEALKQLTRYSDSELMAAVISSFFTVFVKSAGDETGLADMGVTPAPTGTAGAGTVSDVRLGQGAITQLNPGEEIQIADPKRPNAQFDPFVRALCSQIGVAVDLPHELLIKHFTSSYSASRAALLEAWRAFLTRRAWLVDLFAQPIYQWVITEAVARGLIEAPGFFDDPLLRNAWCGTAWTGPTQGQLDPLNEANAVTKLVELGVASRQEITAEIRGGDWENVHAQLAKERRMRLADGLDVTVPPPQGSLPSGSAPVEPGTVPGDEPAPQREAA